MIKPVRRKLRDGWFADSAGASTAVLAQEEVEAQVWSDAPVADDSEWVW